MTARLRSKNERMMLDLLDQIKNLPTDLSSDEFDSLQVIISNQNISYLSWIRLYLLRNWTQVHPIQAMNRSCQTAWLRCWRYRARQKTGPCVVEAVKRMNTSGLSLLFIVTTALQLPKYASFNAGWFQLLHSPLITIK